MQNLTLNKAEVATADAPTMSGVRVMIRNGNAIVKAARGEVLWTADLAGWTKLSRHVYRLTLADGPDVIVTGQGCNCGGGR